MSRALEAVGSCVILKQHPHLTISSGSYQYEISRTGDRSTYTVTDGQSTISVELLWAFGQGVAGQTYVFERNGRLYESRVSFYAAIDGLGLTLGAESRAPKDLGEAAGRLMNAADTRDCFGCHTTNTTSNPNLTVSELVPGIQCSRCHVNALSHSQAAITGKPNEATIGKLSQITTEEMSDFCGQCHRTWSQIATNGPYTILNVRFQPYRLTSSKCYDAADPRIRCTACHDPHVKLERRATAYDGKCLACHSRSATPPTMASKHVCKVSSSNCVSCHMQKIELPGAHYQFSDHRIRIVETGKSYPG